jgi:hypothetical protein
MTPAAGAPKVGQEFIPEPDSLAISIGVGHFTPGTIVPKVEAATESRPCLL